MEGLTSFIGIVHRIASYIGEDYTLVGGAFDTEPSGCTKVCQPSLELDPARAYPDIDTFIEKELELPCGPAD